MRCLDAISNADPLDFGVSVGDGACGRGQLVTTPIFYVNGKPHVGHAYTVVLSDFFARSYRLIGYDTRLITGTDEHGFKVARAARAANVSPLEFCDSVSACFRTMNERLEVRYDDFVRTTEPRHKRVVQALWRRLERRGHIEHGTYEGWYSVADEHFVPDDDVVSGTDPNTGEQCHVSRETGQPVERIEEPTFTFRLEATRDALLAWMARNNVIEPVERRNEALAMVERAPLPPLSMSRPSARVDWGLPVPDESHNTIYVWIDALSNYLTASHADTDAIVRALDDDTAQPPAWPPRLQVLGKDIVRFHAVYWIALLSAAGLQLPHRLLVHAHWTRHQRKLSKSVHASTDGLMALDSHLESLESVDSLRFFLLKHGGLANDSEYSDELLQQCKQSDLISGFGNLLSRSTSKALLPSQCWPTVLATRDDTHLHMEFELLQLAWQTASLFTVEVERLHAGAAIEHVMRLLRSADTLAAKREPWHMDEDSSERAACLRAMLEAVRVAAILLQPAMPASAKRALDRLGVPHTERLLRHATVPLSTHHDKLSFGGQPLQLFTKNKKR